ncbi:MAG TPA: epoxide hydrolase N-terminal domain-containing protein, partial [Candidatus Binataceae bacterium]|nr:epoxide hydrolase N-terminal domain-containing protein [Candidatus Binataceae bacterium]
MAVKVEPFKIEVPDALLKDLRERLERTRFPDEVPDTGWEYGANLAYMKELVAYWRTGYDWRTHEAELNRLPHYKATIDGL